MRVKVEVPTPDENPKRISLGFQCNLIEKIAKMARKPILKSKFHGLCASVFNNPKLFTDTVTQIFCVQFLILKVPR